MSMSSYEGNDKIAYPTLYDFLRLYNFRFLDGDAPSTAKKYNSEVVRIHYGSLDKQWVKFGMYDYGSDVSKEGALKLALSSKLLNAKVESFEVDTYNSELNVFLEESE